MASTSYNDVEMESEFHSDIDIESENSDSDELGEHRFNRGASHSSKSQLRELCEMQEREKRWQKLLTFWSSYTAKDNRRIKKLCRKGIPPTIRPKAWLHLSGGHSLMRENPMLYEALLHEEGDPNIIEEISNMLSTQFSDYAVFENHTLDQQDLFSVLKAFSILENGIKYFRKQIPVAAVLLTQMPAEQAFWTFVAISEDHITNYYDKNSNMLLRDKRILMDHLERVSPFALNHLKKQNVDPMLFISEWFLSLYTLTLPEKSLLRIWDMFLSEGREIIFKVALVLIKGCLGNSLLTDCLTMEDTLEKLRLPPDDLVEEDALAREVQKMNFSEDDSELQHLRQSRKRPSESLGLGSVSKMRRRL